MTMRMRPALLLLLVVLLALPVTAGAAGKKVRLRQFKTCPSLIGYGNRHPPKVTRQGVDGPPPAFAPAGGGTAEDAPPPAAAPVAGKDFSTTNNQEAGVDEPDVVKTDGRTVFAVAQRSLQAVDVRGEQPKLLGTLALGGYNAQLLLEGDRALVMWSQAPAVMYAQEPAIAPAPYPY